MKPEIIAVDVILQLGNAVSANAIKRAFRFYSATYVDKSDPSISFELKHKGIENKNEYLFTFIGAGAELSDVADGVHRFMESFLEELYDESVEEDWLCELGCDELPTIVDYEVESAREWQENGDSDTE